jgi:hypothetical protein
MGGLNITTVGENSLVVLIVLKQPVASGLFIFVLKFFRGIAKSCSLACYIEATSSKMSQIFLATLVNLLESIKRHWQSLKVKRFFHVPEGVEHPV